jgi:hypothetical protein
VNKRRIAIALRSLVPHTLILSARPVMRRLDRCARHGLAVSLSPILGLPHRSVCNSIEVAEIVGPCDIPLLGNTAATPFERVRALQRQYMRNGPFDAARERAMEFCELWPDAVAVDVRQSDPEEPGVYRHTLEGTLGLIDSQLPLVVDLFHFARLLGGVWVIHYCELLQPHTIASVHVNTRDTQDWAQLLAGKPSHIGRALYALRRLPAHTPIVVEVPYQLFLAASSPRDIMTMIEQAMSD